MTATLANPAPAIVLQGHSPKPGFAACPTRGSLYPTDGSTTTEICHPRSHGIHFTSKIEQYKLLVTCNRSLEGHNDFAVDSDALSGVGAPHVNN